MDTVIEVENLHKQFGGLQAIDGLDLHVAAGEIYGLLGPSGSGKTTLIRLITGLLLPTKGQITVMQQPMPHKGILAQIGYMTQASALYEDLTIRENVTFFARMCGQGHNEKRMSEVIELVDLSDRADSLVRTLSGGMKQRASLACALAHAPRLLLLDEPTVGVDPQLRATFWAYFRRLADEGVTLVISSHVMDEAERCDRLGFIRQGKLLAEGTAVSLRQQSNTPTLEDAFLHFASN